MFDYSKSKRGVGQMRYFPYPIVVPNLKKMEIALIILIPLGLWMISLYWLSRWTKFRTFFIINLIILIGYLTWLTQSKLDFLGTDPYGLGQLFLIASVILGHIIAGFIFAFFKRRQINSGQIQ